MALELNEKHYQLLKECSEAKDFTQWNNLMKSTNEIIRLRDGDFSGWTLNGASFHTPNGDYMDLQSANFENSTLEGVNFINAHLFKANFKNAKISYSSFTNADLIKSCFFGAEIISSDFNQANLQESDFGESRVIAANMYESIFWLANLRGARFVGRTGVVPDNFRSNLCGALFNKALFNSDTYFENYNISSKTDFRTISFEAANFSQGLRQTLRYCNRRHNWTDWYENKPPLLRTFVKFFWSLSNYGLSPKRVLTSFFLSTLFFTTIYLFFPPLIEGIRPHNIMDSFYFSIVTMTTLGFGDMHAGKHWIAQLIVMLQVVFGYLLLGSLITMLSELYYSDGPSQELIPHGDKPKSFMATQVGFSLKP